MAIEDCHCMSLRKAARRISNFYDARLAPAGLRATQYSILAVLHRLGGVSINDLAHRLDLDRTTAGKNMRPLTLAGLIKVAPSPTDGRSRIVELTPYGLATLKAQGRSGNGRSRNSSAPMGRRFLESYVRPCRR